MNESKEQTELEDLPPMDLDTVLDDLDLESAPLPSMDEESHNDTLIGTDVQAQPLMEDTDESLSLSEEELDNILGSDSNLFEDLSDHDAGAPATDDMHLPEAGDTQTNSEDFDMPSESPTADSTEVDDILKDDDLLEIKNTEIPDIDLSFPDELTGSHEEQPEASMSLDDGPEEPIALSESELGNILSDVDMSGASEGSGESDVDFGMPPLENLESGEEGATVISEEEEEPITLSEEELSSVILDTEAEESSPSEPMLSSLDMEDEEPITLTPEELGNIVSETETTEDESVSMPEIVTGPEDTAPAFFADEDEGPVALTDSELGSILEDVGEAPMEMAEAPQTEGSSDNLIVLDEYEEAAETAPSREAPVAAMAAPVMAHPAETSIEDHLNKAELKKMISYLDNLFDKLPDDTVQEFSKSEYFDLYRKIMKELGIQ